MKSKELDQVVILKCEEVTVNASRDKISTYQEFARVYAKVESKRVWKPDVSQQDLPKERMEFTIRHSTQSKKLTATGIIVWQDAEYEVKGIKDLPLGRPVKRVVTAEARTAI